MKSFRRSRDERDLDDAIDRAAKGAKRMRRRASGMASDVHDSADDLRARAARKSRICKAEAGNALSCAGKFARRNPVLLAVGVVVAGYALTRLLQDEDDRG